MCPPAAAFGLSSGLQIVGGLWNYREQYMAAKETASYMERQAAEIAAGVKRDSTLNYAANARQARQIQLAEARQVAEITRAALNRRGIAAASAGSAGVEGGSIEQLLGDFERQELARIEVARENADANLAALDDQNAATQARAERILAESRPQPVQTPSLFGTLLSIAGGVAQSYFTSGLYDPGGSVTPNNPPTAFPANNSLSPGFYTQLPG